MTPTRPESLRDDLATIIQSGTVARMTSDEIAGEVLAMLGALPPVVGEISDVHAWGRSLSDSEIIHVAARPRYGECALPLELWKKFCDKPEQDANFYPKP